MRAFISSLLVCGVACSRMYAQVGAPILGFVPDGPRIRTMHGLPASGAIGGALNPGRDFALAAISPRQDFVLASAKDDGSVLIVSPDASLKAVNGASGSPDSITMSPNGSAAVLWFSSISQLQVISGLPGAPGVRTINVSFLNAAPNALSVSDDGQWTVGLWSGSVYSFGPAGEVIPLQADPGISALAFLHGRHDVTLATASRITTITDVGGASQMAVIYDYPARESNLTRSLAPAALAVAFDNSRVVAVDGLGRLTAVKISDSTAISAACGCKPEGVFGLGGSVFRLTGMGTEVKLFDAISGSVLVVPLSAQASLPSGGQQ